MTTFESTIEVDRPIRDVYDAWTQFESFPQFMEHVDSVQQIDDTHLHWNASIAGRNHEWDAEITQQRPDEIVSWRSVDGADNAGSVSFEPIEHSRTKVTLQLQYEPESFLEKAAATTGIFHLSVDRDLATFRDLVESDDDSGHGWRGEVIDGTAIDDPSSTSIFTDEAASASETFESADSSTFQDTDSGVSVLQGDSA